MFFQIVTEVVAPGSPVIKRRWVYRQGTAKNPGNQICQSSRFFNEEADARRDIAEARKAFAGGRFAKVEVE